MRTAAMERYGETKKRKELDQSDDQKERKSRRSSSGVLEFLREKMESDNQIRQENLSLEREARVARERQHNDLVQQNQQTLQVLLQQQQQMMVILLKPKHS